MAASIKNATAFRGILQKLKLPSIPIPARLKGGRLERAAKYMQTVAFDYKEAVKDVFVTAVEKPVKSGIYLLLSGSAIYAIFNNPDEDSHAIRVTEYSTELATVSRSVMNPKSADCLSQRQSAVHYGLLRRLNLALFSILWIDNYDKTCTSYLASCPSLKVPWREVPPRIVDVGFLNRWFLLERQMKDYDVNPDEWKQLDEKQS